MRKKKILFGLFQHETNTFSPFPTDMECYKAGFYAEDEGVIEMFKGSRTILGGYIDAFAGSDEFELVPLLAADAEPSGKVTGDTYATISERLIERIRRHSDADALLLSLHGAMTVETTDDGEGTLLRAIREVVGNEIPIAVTLDLHANISKAMVEYATVLVGFKKYPHSDMYERGLDTAHMLQRILRGELHPVMSYKSIPMLFPLLPTNLEAYKPLTAEMLELESRPKIENMSIYHGCFLTDIADMSASVVAVTDGDRALADAAAEQLANSVYSRRAELKIPFLSPAEAIERAKTVTGGPAVLADFCDNPGGGSTCDGTHLLRAMVEADVQNAVLAHIVDPESVDACFKAGPGARVKLAIGGKRFPELLGAPVECEAEVLTLTNGKYRNFGPMHAGFPRDLRRTAAVAVGGITVLLSDVVTQAYDIALLFRHGIDPTKCAIVAVKSAVHYRGAYEPIAGEIITVKCPGLVYAEPSDLTYEHCKVALEAQNKK